MRLPQKTAVICRLSLAPEISTRLDPSLPSSTLTLEQDECQFASDVFHCGHSYHIIQESCLHGCKIFWGMLTFAVVAFLLTNFIRANKWYAHSRLNLIWPPNSASCCRSTAITIPLAAATATGAVTIHPNLKSSNKPVAVHPSLVLRPIRNGPGYEATVHPYSSPEAEVGLVSWEGARLSHCLTDHRLVHSDASNMLT